VRQFDLHTVSKTSYRAENIRALAVNVSADGFNGVVGPYAAAQAYTQHQLGCANYSP